MKKLIKKLLAPIVQELVQEEMKKASRTIHQQVIDDLAKIVRETE